MTRWQVVGGFGVEHLVRAEFAAPAPGPGEVQVSMRAWSLNFRDLLMVRGQYDPRLALPYTPLSDGVGTVTAIGAGVSRAAIGDRVCPIFSPTWVAGPPHPDAVRKTRGGPIPGVLSSDLTLPEGAVVRVPDWLTDAEAASLPCAGVTAYSAVAVEGRITAGDVVLVIGSGGVSLFAVQIARMLGARVVAVTSTPDKAERLRALGVEHVWSSRDEPAWGRVVRQWSGGGVDLAVDVGGAGTVSQSIDAVRVGGTVAIIGNLGGATEPISVLPILMRQIRCQGVFVGSRHTFEALVRAMSANQFRPVVDRVLAYDQAPAAFDAFAQGGHFGKVAITA